MASRTQKFAHNEDEHSTRLKLISGSATGSHRNITNISITQLIYTANLIANMGPHWKVEAETGKVEYILS